MFFLLKDDGKLNYMLIEEQNIEAGDSNVTDVANTTAPENNDSQTDTKQLGFDDYLKNHEKAVAANADAKTEEKPDEKSGEPETEEKPKDGEGQKEEKPGDAKTDEKTEKTDDKSDKSEDRAGRHKALKEDSEAYHALIEQHGGLEAITARLESGALLEDPSKRDELVSTIFGLSDSRQITQDIFYKVLDMPANQVVAFNDVLINGFEMPAELALTQPELVSVMEYVTARMATDKADFFDEMKGEIDRYSSALTPEARHKRELAAKESEIERLKNPEKAKDEAGADDFGAVMDKTLTDYANFTTEVFTEASEKPLADYGLAVSKDDAPELKAAKERFSSVLRSAVVSEMSKSEIGQQAINELGNLISDTGKNLSTTRSLRGRFASANTATTKQFLREIAPLLKAGAKTVVQTVEDVDDLEKPSDVILKEKESSLEEGKKAEVDYRNSKDPFAAALKKVERK